MSKYKVSNWNGRKNYTCNRCPFASLDEAVIKAHVKIHPEKIVEKPKTRRKRAVKVEKTDNTERNW